MLIDQARWLEVLTFCGVRALTAARWAPVFEKHVQPEKFSLGLREIDDFVGQVLHETQRLEHLEENLNYRAQRLCEVWPKRFIGIAAAIPYEYNPQALAEKVYGMRADLGNMKAGDGWKYRGMGIPHITGKGNYALLEKLTGLPLVEKPDLLTEPDAAMRCGVLWWEKRVPDSAIDTLERVSRAVNGGVNGLQDRRLLTNKAKEALGC